MKILHALFFVFLAVAATAADNPYNETADAKLEIKQALTQAATTQDPDHYCLWRQLVRRLQNVGFCHEERGQRTTSVARL